MASEFDEEKEICEKVTGFAYEDLWNPKNAGMSEDDAGKSLEA